MLKLILPVLFFLIHSFACLCQSLDSLTILVKDIQRGKNDSVRFASNEKFNINFEKILLQNGSFSRNFDSLKNVSVKTPDDKSFRIYTWAVPHYDGSAYEFFGFIQVHSMSSDTLIRLKDSTGVIKKPESEKLFASRWLGAVYYSVIPIKKSGKTYYTLLGWKGSDQARTQKIIDVLYFNGNQPKFGFPIFKTGSVFRNRIVFIYNAQAAMTLHFDKNFNGIVFDHFSTNKNNPTVINGPDGTYDAFKISKGRWVLYTDVDVRTKFEPNENLPEPPSEK